MLKKSPYNFIFWAIFFAMSMGGLMMVIIGGLAMMKK
jgi:hypothetical protein